MQNSTTLDILKLLKSEMKLRITNEGIYERVVQHPYPSSLLAVSELLEEWNISNAAYQLSVEEIANADLPIPFIACFLKGEFVLITEKGDNGFTVSGKRWNKKQFTVAEFKKYYQGTILAFQIDNFSGEDDYALKRRRELINLLRLPFVIFIVVSISLLFLGRNLVSNDLTWVLIGSVILKTVGIFTTVMLLIQSVDADNPLIQRFCSAITKSNCTSILSSDAAKITPELSWSEIGFFYFAGTWNVLIFSSANSSLLTVTFILNLLALPYTFYSIYYQWKIAGEWCIFCCVVQALLWLDLIIRLPFQSPYLPLLRSSDAFQLFIEMFSPIIIWIVIKPLLRDSFQLKAIKPEYYRYKFNKDLFNYLHSQQLRYKLPDEENLIVLGNKEAENTITLVSNPFCSHCSHVHHVIEDLLALRSDLKIQLVFINRATNIETDKKVIRHFMALRNAVSSDGIGHAINSWYSQKTKNFDSWSKNYPIDNKDEQVTSLIAQRDWCRMTDIRKTPTIFLNGRQLPDAYRPEDIRYIL